MQQDLTVELSSLYAVRRRQGMEPGAPELLVLPSLRELALYSYVQNVLLSASRPLVIPDKHRDLIIEMLPVDLPLERVLSIETGQYWMRRCLAEFPDVVLPTERGMDMRRFYFETRIARYFDPDVGEKTDPGELQAVARMGAPHVESLTLHIQRVELLPALLPLLPGLHALHFIYVAKPIDTKGLLDSFSGFSTQNTDPLVESQELTMRGRTLPEIATVIIDPAAPFHKLPDYKLLMKFDHREAFSTAIRGGCLRAGREDVGASDSFVIALIAALKTFTGQLTNLALTASLLTDRGACLLIKYIQDRFNTTETTATAVPLQSLDLSFNKVGDETARYCSKLFVASEKHNLPVIVTHLSLVGNAITKGGCLSLGKALGQPTTGLEALDLSCNELEDSGYILLCNGILKAAIKHGNTSMRELRLSNCRIRISASLLAITSKLLENTAVSFVSLTGNPLASSSEEWDDVKQGVEAILAVLHRRYDAARQACTEGLTNSRTACPTVVLLSFPEEFPHKELAAEYSVFCRDMLYILGTLQRRPEDWALRSVLTTVSGNPEGC
ncbi:hypothetical protein GMRT_10577 [Giardia muris]|uniref:Leucine-rich repeat protein n=1 Tax=Giardia muris TaxID=5742 RepID=A0A4Z1SMC9_GIAMU|nr:hypothetical protein GMRT_10577 [Giardia muris]|eukprot:TNJ26844.1 hypothetical protein GMRT_10577 [Giardia muris]